MFLSGLFLTTVLAVANALYSSSDDVINLTPANFESKVMNSDEVWFVEFYAPWCGHCQQLAPAWKKAATALKGVVKVAAVDANEHNSLGGKYGVRGFPTIKIFGLNKNSPEDYNGARSADGIVNAALDHARKLVQSKMSGKSGSGGGSRSGGGSGGSGNQEDVIELTDSNFESLVINSDDVWLVEFYAPWCGHCKRLAPEWKKAATELKGKVKVGALDADQHKHMAQMYQIQGFPTIKWFASGVKRGPQDAHDYDGSRDASGIVAFALDKVSENIPPPEIKQLLNDESVKEACDEQPICVISFLPHILDSQAAGRNKYINILKELGEKYKKKLWGWIWSEAAAQMDIEQALEVGGFGYPALVAINAKKAKYVLMRGAFTKEGIDEFLRAIAVGRGRTAPLRNEKIPKATKVDAWDGKDGQLPVEDDNDDTVADVDDKKKKTEL
ncbi:protein disulfide-isomerase A6 homolog [Lineus longissimus]|uniref:protein disulfide-isomerase A6 homolog n=1 Tax=Lineus longissimus TaxID=88925 RepID=UPI002B4E00D3